MVRLDVESLLIGRILTSQEDYDKVLSWFRDSLFVSVAQPLNESLLIICQKLRSSNIDTTISNILILAEEMDLPIKPSEVYIREVMDVSKTANIDILIEAVWTRYLNQAAGKLANILKTAKSEDTIVDVHREIEKLLIRGSEVKPTIKSMVEGVKRGANVFQTGFAPIDAIANGLTVGEITTIGGRPGHGKTTLKLNILRAAAIKHPDEKIFSIEREMGGVEIARKLLVIESDFLTSLDLRMPRLDTKVIQEIERLEPIIESIYKNVTFRDDITSIDDGIRLIKIHKPKLFIDDFIQMALSSNYDSERRLVIEESMLRYKWLAKIDNNTGIILSQLNREIDKRYDKIPTLSDFSESSAIEHFSENCVFIVYPYNYDNEEDPYTIKLITKKARYGKIGEYTVYFNGERCKFYGKRKDAIG